jgi:RecA/RadA recombinase
MYRTQIEERNMERVTFINRDQEIKVIDDAFDDLLSQNRLLRTPIIDFYGIEGIGKTQILQRVIQKCQENDVPYINSNVSKEWQVEGLLIDFDNIPVKYKQQLFPLQDAKSTLQQFIEYTKAFLERKPLVMLLDSIDSADEHQLERLENMLSELLSGNNLVVILTSRRDVSFEHEKSVARKLKTISVQPFNRLYTDAYLDSTGSTLSPKIRDLIFTWTRGYPLAMQVMVEAITERALLSISRQQQKELIEHIVNRVINERILADVEQGELKWFQTILSLLAVPRRFNLVIMQKLIERFEPNLKLASSLAYIALPKRIVQATSALSWDLKKAGFAVNDSVRNILLIQLSITRSKHHRTVHQFLAELNHSNAAEVTGTDRIRYQQEYLYHSAKSVAKQQLPSLLKTTIGQIMQEAQDQPDQLVQFREEFKRDDELKEALGEHVAIVLDLIDSETSAEG